MQTMFEQKYMATLQEDPEEGEEDCLMRQTCECRRPSRCWTASRIFPWASLLTNVLLAIVLSYSLLVSGAHRSSSYENGFSTDMREQMSVHFVDSPT